MAETNGNGANGANGAIAPTTATGPAPISTQGRTPGNRRKRRDELQVQEPVTVEGDRQEYQEVMGTVLNSTAGQLTEVVTTTQAAVRTMEQGVVEFLAEDLSGSPARIANGLQRATGGVNNAAFFRTDATQFAADFVSNLRGAASQD